MSLTTTSRSTFDFNQRLYEFWLQYSDNYQAIEQCLQQHLPAAIHTLYPRVNNRSFNILSIGAGNGQNDLRILEEVTGCLKKEDADNQEIEVCNTAIEPNPVHIQDYITLMREKAQSLQEGSNKVIKFHVENKTFEDYEISDHENNRFDMVHAIQSLRFLDDPKSALKYCYDDELKSKGLMAYIASSGNSEEVFPLVASILNKHRLPDQRENANWQPSIELATQVTRHHERFQFYSTLDVTDIFDENSQNWSLVLDAVTCTEDFCEKADKRVIEEICELVKELASTNNKGRFVVRIENELTVLHKLEQ